MSAAAPTSGLRVRLAAAVASPPSAVGTTRSAAVGTLSAAAATLRYLAIVMLAIATASGCTNGGGAGDTKSPIRSKTATRPSIVLIVADDLGYGDLGSYGSAEAPTPNIDSIARTGVRFTNAYVTAPLCSPSRAALLTGRYQQRFGHEFNTGPLARDQSQGLGLPLTEVTLANALKRAGYMTALVGKWQLGSDARHHPLERGFDEFFGFLFGGPYIDAGSPGVETIRTVEAEEGPASRNPRDPIWKNRSPVPEKEYLTDAFTREAVNFIREHGTTPFFLYVAYKTPHTPFQATERYLARFPTVTDPKRRVYAAMIAAMDDGVGAILMALRAKRIEDSTLVVFLSDNGAALYTGAGSNAPLRGGKYLLTEGGIRVPFMIRWPAARIEEGRVYQGLASSLDIFPTAIAAAGIAAPAGLDGVDLVPYLTGRVKGSPHDVLFWRVGSNQAVRRDNWKLFRGGTDVVGLFDLAGDMGETRNVAAQHPDIVRDLTRELSAWNATLAQPRWPPQRRETAPMEGGTIQVDM